jgi:GNAT superfamily N-acetyltransferase
MATEDLSASCWASGIPPDTVANALCFDLFDQDRQIGFASVISDATVAYLADVFVLPEYRGLRLAKWLLQCVASHRELRGLRRWTLAHHVAHRLYVKFDLMPLEIFTERHDPNVHRKTSREES